MEDGPHGRHSILEGLGDGNRGGHTTAASYGGAFCQAGDKDLLGSLKSASDGKELPSFVVFGSKIQADFATIGKF